MKRYGAIVLLMTLLLTGCIKQDLSGCATPGELRLKPELYNSNGKPLLAEKVNSIDAFVYNIDNRMEAHQRVVKDSRNQFPEIVFALEPGDYRVVCWANIEAETRIVGLENKLPLENCYLETLSDETGNKLYYAPQRTPTDRPDPVTRGPESDGLDYDLYTVTVLPNQTNYREMLFTRAHRTVNVFLNNYEIIDETELPQIRFVNIPVRSDFLLRTDPSRKTYQSQTVFVETTNGKRMMVALNAMITSFTDDMLIEVIGNSGKEIVTTVNLKQYVEKNSSRIDDMNEFNVEISYLMNGSVEINLPDWGNTPIEPEW